LLRRRQRLSQANVRSTIHRSASTTNPFEADGRLTISKHRSQRHHNHDTRSLQA
jgi:hypothetical protein